jgi:L-2,4-diaminobutyrate decarboxylase
VSSPSVLTAPPDPVAAPAAGILDHDLLASSPAGIAALSSLVPDMLRAAAVGLRRRCGPLPPGTPQELGERVAADLADGLLPRCGVGTAALLPLAQRYAQQTVDLSDPGAAAHLQPPALTVAVAADLLASAFNASVDTWDSGPGAVELERHVIGELTALAGLGARSDGVLTSGGTASNLQALLIARDRTVADRLGVVAGVAGVTALGRRPVVLCSSVAHFSVARACAVLGLGEEAVVAVPVDQTRRMQPDALETALAGLPHSALPIAVVATAGSTDFGSIDPLAEIAAVTSRWGVRLHVDAAYGGGALFSDRLRPLLHGLDAADSVTLDLHKTAWQPAAASALLLRDAGDFTGNAQRVDYLNPHDDGEQGYDGLLDRSLATTRRADALKIAATFLALGRDGLGALFDTCHDLARHAEAAIGRHPRLELTAGAVLSTVVFRYVPGGPGDSDRVNGALRRRLLRGGLALIGRTTVPGTDGAPSVRLKLTLLNPLARPADIDALLDAIVEAGRAEER